MTFRKTEFISLIILVLTLCIWTGAVTVALSESEMTGEQIDEASEKAYDEAKLQGETQIAFTTVATLGQYLSDLMVYTYGEIPVSETDSANAAVQLVDEVIRRADLCFHSEEAGSTTEKLSVFNQAKEAWKTAAEQFGVEGEKFKAGMPLTDSDVIDLATDAFGRFPAEVQPVYLEKTENLYRAIWQVLRQAVVAKVGEALQIPGIAEFVDFDEISEFEDAVVDILADMKDALSTLYDGFNGRRSEERARIEQVGSRLNSLESEVRLVVNALGIDTVSRLLDDGEM